MAISRSSGGGLFLDSFLFGAIILLRPLDILAQSVGSQKRPVGIAQELARQDHHVCLARADDLVRLGWISNHAYSPGWNAGFTADFFSECYLISRPRQEFLPEPHYRRRNSRSGQRRAA